MKRLSIVALLLLLSVAAGALAEAKEPQRPRCETCGMYADESSTRVLASISVSGKAGEYVFESLGCMYDKLIEWGDAAEVQSFKVLDYSSFGTKKPRFVDGMEAWYLFNTADLEGSMPPYIAAFASDKAASAASEELGGAVVQGWVDLMAEFDAIVFGTPAGEVTGAPAGALYVCPCTGDCCLDIVSDQPGECPRCGMALVPKDGQ
jgi:hypothetical protein